MSLSDAKLRTLKPSDKMTRVLDGQGLMIQVEPSGSKLWRFRYRFEGKEKMLALGAYPTVSLLEARRRRDEALLTLSNGRDPSAEKREARERAKIASNAKTFKDVALDWLSLKTWSPRYGEQMRRRVELNLFNHLGTTRINAVTKKQVVDCIREIEGRGALVMARELLAVLHNIFQYAIVEELMEHDPTVGVRKVLRDPAPVQHHLMIGKAELPEFFQKIRDVGADEIVKLAIKFTMHTLVRSGETLGAHAREFDGDMWRIPKERMKMDRPHIVPLTPAVSEIIRRAREFNPTGKLFPISSNTMLYCLYRAGYHKKATMHGMRRLASTILNENGWNRDWVEMQLAHSDNTVRGIYNAAEWIEGRTEMLHWWSDFLLKQEYGDLENDF